MLFQLKHFSAIVEIIFLKIFICLKKGTRQANNLE